MMPVGVAFERTGAAAWVADGVAQIAAGGGTWLVIGILLLATSLLSNVINNAAAAVLMAPIAVRLAVSLAVPVVALLMAVAIGASAAFLTPIGHQSNTLVMEPGGYRFGDYWRLGAVVTLVVALVGTAGIMVVWGS